MRRIGTPSSMISKHLHLDPGERGPLAVSLSDDWPSILRDNQRWMRLVVRSRLREPQAIDEVMQNIALSLARQCAPPRDRARLPAWLYRVAVRQALLYRRAAGRSRRLIARAAQHRRLDGNSAGQNADPLEWLILRERGQMIRGALDRLPPRDSEILLLKYVENWTTHELSDRLGVSRSAIEARLHRVRQRLRADLLRSRVVESRE
jgi:RNA polymerase sigma-70 factor (ECF subfamily)